MPNLRATLRSVSLVVFAVAVASAQAESKWPFRIVPHDGRPVIDPFAQLTAKGLVRPASKGSDNKESRNLSWFDIDSLTVVPPASDDGDQTILVIDDDGRDRITSNFGKIKLRKGFHRFHLLYASQDGIEVNARALQLDYKGPKQTSWTEVPASMLKHQPHWFWPPENKSPGFDDEGLRQPDKPAEVEDKISARVHTWNLFGNVPSRPEDLRQTTIHHYGSVPQVRPPDGRTLKSESGVVLYGFFDIPADGEYRFRLKSDGVAALVIGDASPRFGQLVLKEEGDEWDVRLAYDGRLAAPVKSFENGMLTFFPRHGSSKHDETSIDVPIPKEIIVDMVRRKDGIAITLPDEPTSKKLDVVFAEGSSGQVRGVIGEAVAIRDEKLVFNYEGEERTVPLERVQGIRFAQTEYTSGRPPKEPVLLVGPPGIHSIPANFVASEGEWSFTFAALGVPEEKRSDPAYSFQLNRVTLRGIDVYGGGAIKLLDLPPEVVSTPLFDLPPPVAFGQLPDGEPLAIGRKKFDSGFAAAPKSSIAFLVGRTFKTLKISLGMASTGSASVRLLADGEAVWSNEELSPSDGVVEVNANIAGRDRIVFEVDFGKQFDVNDLVVFGNPELVRGPAEAEVAANVGDAK